MEAKPNREAEEAGVPNRLPALLAPKLPKPRLAGWLAGLLIVNGLEPAPKAGVLPKEKPALEAAPKAGVEACGSSFIKANM